MTDLPPSIGIIGGSGLYDLEGFEQREEITVETPFGAPSDKFVTGLYAGRRVYFLPRHGKGHRILPTELNHRANIWALRSLNVRWIITVTAVGSLKEEYRPRDVMLFDQFFDRTSRREHHTFFGNGIVGHVAFADPISEGLRSLLSEAAKAAGARVHDGGTYVNMDGPAFSTRAESNANRQLGFDVIGMTNLPEAKLAREAEIALATLAMITDYDCWKTDEAHVTADAVMAHVSANAAMAKQVIARVIPRIPAEPSWSEHQALNGALMTDRKLWPQATIDKLGPILARFL
ncbi:S-methyl-5'-thioadenosine phosphorylase [Brevifollis gellanilyticus]|uniref:S-methyl-5'-thioadenosine phosphorylase n=1 Tax=Brevifollis gellanilyticus TaxID=748831 RepID=A0A512MCV7_9BACT|nr:S-methyl-5'-thioadenosine phosphorylase [Brevifollis gellanilyticus]GEP44573.1 S-methyl-5'-thioadenosine phosphorylase [Brevifollis gellanilyticus]